MYTRLITHYGIEKLVEDAVSVIGDFVDREEVVNFYPVPRGGIPVAYYLLRYFPRGRIVDDPGLADIIVDDLIDSGKTSDRFIEKYPEIPFVALLDKRKDPDYEGRWIVFPWEQGDLDQSAEDIPLRLLQYIGEDIERGGLRETPTRFLKAWRDWTQGYRWNPAEVMKVFEDGAESYDEMVVVKDLPFYSHCEHHLAPFFGTATIAYIPHGHIVGLSKLSRLLDIYAKRLQVQERLTAQIADALEEYLQPKGAGVLIKARHLCMESRGICKQGHETITSALRGALLDLGEAREEFMSLAR